MEARFIAAPWARCRSWMRIPVPGVPGVEQCRDCMGYFRGDQPVPKATVMILEDLACHL